MNNNDLVAVKNIVKTALKYGYAVTVRDCEGVLLSRCKDAKEIVAMADDVEECSFIFIDSTNTRIGFISFVFDCANDTNECINDYSDNADIRALLRDSLDFGF